MKRKHVVEVNRPDVPEATRIPSVSSEPDNCLGLGGRSRIWTLSKESKTGVVERDPQQSDRSRPRCPTCTGMSDARQADAAVMLTATSSQPLFTSYACPLCNYTRKITHPAATARRAREQAELPFVGPRGESHDDG